MKLSKHGEHQTCIFARPCRLFSSSLLPLLFSASSALHALFCPVILCCFSFRFSLVSVALACPPLSTSTARPPRLSLFLPLSFYSLVRFATLTASSAIWLLHSSSRSPVRASVTHLSFFLPVFFSLSLSRSLELSLSLSRA